MTQNEAEAIRRMLECERDRDQWSEMGKGWCEVGRFVSLDPRTVRSLEAAGLVETVSDERHTYARLRQSFSPGPLA